MFIVQNTLVSEDILEQEFVCNLKACKGACCVLGDSGAPLENHEVGILADIYPLVKPYLSPLGIKAIEEQGTSVIDMDGDQTTTLIDGDECAYVVFEQGTAYCGIEKAYLEGKVDFKKPISCHLYPIRVKVLEDYDALNYDRWNICKDACTLGKQLAVPVYKFLKEPLIRKYGEAWYEDLEVTAEYLREQK